MDSLPADPQRTRALKYFLIATLGVGALASLLSQPSLTGWYAGLVRPAIAPPSWIFAPVWTALYGLMAVAAWRTWRVTGIRSIEMLAFAVQLVFNLAWHAIFFRLHRIAEAFGACVLLDLGVLYTTLLFLRRERIAGLLMLPCLGWVLFLTVLTQAFWLRNP